MENLDFAKGTILGFQNGGTPIGFGIQDLHNTIMYYMIMIVVVVLYIYGKIYKGSVEKIENKKSRWEFAMFKKFHILRNKISHGTFLEIFWTIIPSIILVKIAMPSFSLLYSMDEIIDPEETIKVIGNQWYWSYEFYTWDLEVKMNSVLEKNEIETLNTVLKEDELEGNFAKMKIGEKISGGEKEHLVAEISVENVEKGEYKTIDSYMVATNELSKGDLRLLETDNPLVVGTKKFIRFIITSTDVLHSFSIPTAGIKMDAVPGRLNQISAIFAREGALYGQCSELCGVGHGYMPIKIISLNNILKV